MYHWFHTFSLFEHFLSLVKWILNLKKSLWLSSLNGAAQNICLKEKQQAPNQTALSCTCKQLSIHEYQRTCHLWLITCSGLFQLAHLLTGAQTASTHATAIMELTAVPTMASANVPQDGLAFTVHSVSDCYCPFIVLTCLQISDKIFLQYFHTLLISSSAAKPFSSRRCKA